MSSGLAFERAAMPCDEPSPMVAVRVACVQNERRGVLGESDEKGEASWIERMKAERGGSLWTTWSLPSPPSQTFPPLSPCTPRPSTEDSMSDPWRSDDEVMDDTAKQCRTAWIDLA